MKYSPSREAQKDLWAAHDGLIDGLTQYKSGRKNYWRGKAHRARLIDTDEYVRTSEVPRLTIRWGYGKLRSFQTQINQIIRKMNEAVLPLPFDPTMCWCGRQSCSRHQENS